MDIYRTWNVQSRDEVHVLRCPPHVHKLTIRKECVVASRQALEAWLSRHIAKPKPSKTSPKASPGPSKEAAPKSEESASSPSAEACPAAVTIPMSDIVCSHGKLDPHKAPDMKVIRAVSSY